MSRPEEYGIAVRLVRDDGVEMYEGRVAELPDVVVYGDSFGEAYSGAIEVIEITQSVFAEKGKVFPAPERIEEDFSGRVTLRMSKSLHRSLHAKAQIDCVSLNQWIVEAIGWRLGGATNPANSVIICTPVVHSNTPQVSIKAEEATLWASVRGTAVYLTDSTSFSWTSLKPSPAPLVQADRE